MDSENNQYQIQQLEDKLNSYDWQYIDSQLEQLPKNPVYQVQIPDSKRVQKYFKRFRYVLEHQKYHLSGLTLALCNYLLEFSTNNYYSLMLRKQYITRTIQDALKSLSSQDSGDKLKQIIKSQFSFMNNLLEYNPKEYHIWTYKKDLIFLYLNTEESNNTEWIQKIGNIREEVYKSENNFIFQLLIQDCRNYHAWDYRFWMITFLNKIEQQRVWIDSLISNKNQQQELVKILNSEGFLAKQLKTDWINVNSVWSHRFNLIKYSKQNHNKQSEQTFSKKYQETLARQIQRAVNLLKTHKFSQSIWNYLYGLLGLTFQNEKLLKSFRLQIQNNLFSDQVSSQLSQESLGKLNRFELNFLNKIEKAKNPNNYQRQFLFINLLRKIDPTRFKYYQYLLKKLEKK